MLLLLRGMTIITKYTPYAMLQSTQAIKVLPLRNSRADIVSKSRILSTTLLVTPTEGDLSIVPKSADCTD